MTPLRCIAVDDEPLALKVISTYVAQFPSLQLVQTFHDALSAAEFMRHSPVDLLFADIQMPDISGLDLVRSLSQKPIIIFTTAHKKFAFEGFELEALDYLLKPIEPERFARAVSKALDFHAYQHAPADRPAENLFVYSEYRMMKIALSDVEFIESMEDYIHIHRPPGKTVVTLMSLKKMLEKLPADQFLRIHRSYVVPLAKVFSVQGRKVQLTTGKELPVSDSYYDDFQRWWKSR
jgi:two-component system, LytTR family, response regulator